LGGNLKKILQFAFILVLLTACSPSESALQTAIADTAASQPTITPTNTPIPPTPTFTPIPPTLTPSLTPTPTIAKELLECSTKFSEWQKAPEAPFSVIMNEAQTMAIEDAGLLKPMDKSKLIPFPADEIVQGTSFKTTMYVEKTPFILTAKNNQNTEARPMRAICVKKVSDMDAFVIFMQVATNDQSVENGYVILRVFMYDVRKFEDRALKALRTKKLNNKMISLSKSGGYMGIFYDINLEIFKLYPTANYVEAAYMVDELEANKESHYDGSASPVKRILSGHATKSDEAKPFVGQATFY
jgi:hypothetical protein